MRQWATLILLWGIACPAIASKTMSVEQMENLLVNIHGKPDDKVLGELEDVQLTERVSLTRLTRWEAKFPSKRVHEQLVKLADLSAFLEPLGTDVIADPPPDLNTQKRMLWMAEQYVRTTTSRLPDLFATRSPRISRASFHSAWAFLRTPRLEQEAGRSAGLKGGARRYVVDLSVNPSGLTFTQGADGSSSAQFDCALEAYDAEAKPVNTLGRGLAFNFSRQQYQHLQATGSSFPVRLALDLPAGGVAMRVVVYDPASARTGSVEIPVQVGDK